MQADEQQLRQWMMAGQAGSAQAQADLLRALVPLLHRFYRRRLHGGDAASDDLVQETLIAVHQKRATYDPARPFTGWLFAIARYKMIDHFRRAGRHCAIEDIEDILAAEGFENASGARMDIAQLLETLPPKQAEAIRATRIEGLSVAEAAERQGIGVSDIKVSVHRGLKALTARIRGYEI